MNMPKSEHEVKETVCRWLYDEKDRFNDRFNEKNSIKGIVEGEQFRRHTPWSINLTEHARRAKIIHEGLGHSSPESKQQLSKHLAAVSFFLVGCRKASGEVFDESAMLSYNLHIGSELAEAKITNPGYDDLENGIGEMLSPRAASSFDFSDQLTWEPFKVNIGVAANMLVKQIVEIEQPNPQPDTLHQA